MNKFSSQCEGLNSLPKTPPLTTPLLNNWTTYIRVKIIEWCGVSQLFYSTKLQTVHSPNLFFSNFNIVYLFLQFLWKQPIYTIHLFKKIHIICPINIFFSMGWNIIYFFWEILISPSYIHLKLLLDVLNHCAFIFEVVRWAYI